MTVKDFFSFKANRYFWVNLLAMIGLVGVTLFMVFTGLDIYTHHGEAVVVPDVKGMQKEEAEAFLQKRGLFCLVSDSSYVKNKPSGSILDLTPAAGQQVKEGRVIYLTINSLNTPMQLVPDVADNSSVRQAQARMQSAGFKLTENELVHGERDWVYGVKYKGRQLRIGEKIPTGATVTLMVGGGGSDDAYLDDSLSVSDGAEGGADATDESWF